MTVSRRMLFSGAASLAALATLAACGGGTDDPGSPSSDSSQASGTITVTDANGDQVEVPAKAERVVTTHYAATQAMLDIGVVPFATGVTNEAGVPPEYWEKIKDLPTVNTVEIDVPAIADLEPDLVLVHNAVEEDVLTQLRQIGVPLFTFTLRGGQRAKWEARVEEIARALNKPDAPAALDKAFDERIQEVVSKYGDVAKGKTVGLVSVFEENNFYVWGSGNMGATLLLPVGFTWSPLSDKAVAGEKEPEATVSFERLTEVFGDCDVLFVNSDMRGNYDPLVLELQKTALWAQLPAVKSGQTFDFGKATIAGYGDAYYSMDRIEAALAKMKG